MLNRGAKKVFASRQHRWVFNARAMDGRRRVSGWVRRNRLLHPPPAEVDPKVNPPPPGSGGAPRTLDGEQLFEAAEAAVDAELTDLDQAGGGIRSHVTEP
jgi:hypothetical protein